MEYNTLMLQRLQNAEKKTKKNLNKHIIYLVISLKYCSKFFLIFDI